MKNLKGKFHGLNNLYTIRPNIKSSIILIIIDMDKKTSYIQEILNKFEVFLSEITVMHSKTLSVFRITLLDEDIYPDL